MRAWVLAVGVMILGWSLWSGPVQAKSQMASSASLEGSKWSVTITPDAAAVKQGQKPSKDTLIFKAGKLTSTACVKYGFLASPYTSAAAQTGAWSFTTEQTSPKEGKMSWMGEASGNLVKGTMTWTKGDGSVLNYTFEGKKKAKPQAS